MNVLFIDNFDSFTFNLVDEFEKRGANVTVWRNDISADAAYELAVALPEPRLVVLSPGPGAPRDAGCSVDLILRIAHGEASVPVFGVCLGHQAIVEAFGGEVGFAGSVVHGKAAQVDHAGWGPLCGLNSPLTVARYHSLVAHNMPPPLLAVASTVPRPGESQPLMMGLRHRDLPFFGVQFHPESILTPLGGQLIDGVLRWALEEQDEGALHRAPQPR